MDNDDVQQSIEADDISNSITPSHQNQQIDRLIGTSNRNIVLGRTVPVPLMDIRKCMKYLAIMASILLIFFSSWYTVSKISFTKRQNPLVIKKDQYARSTDGLKHNRSVFLDNKLFPFMTDDEPDDQNIFTKERLNDDSTCHRYEMISDLFNQLCLFKFHNDHVRRLNLTE